MTHSEPSAPDALQTCLAALYLAQDDADVAEDFLCNLTGPTGRDATARAAARVNWRGWRERVSNGIPQGDQLRRATNAVRQAMEQAERLRDCTPPSPFAVMWTAMLDRVEAANVRRWWREMLRTDRAITADDVAGTLRAVRSAAATMRQTQVRLTLAQMRDQA